MIHDALRLLVNRLNQELGTGGEEPVTLGNIAFSETTGDAGANASNNLARIVLTLVNIIEDDTSKNGPHHRLKNGKVVYENRPVNLYLYLLFCANHGVYATALRQLSRIIEFFQSENVFTVRNLPDTTGVNRGTERLGNLRMIVDLYPLTFEQINYLWGSLGGKQVPFVLYRARVVSIKSDEIRDVGEPLRDIEIDDRAL